jgi:hypothetical protein
VKLTATAKKAIAACLFHPLLPIDADLATDLRQSDHSTLRDFALLMWRRNGGTSANSPFDEA